MENTCTREHPCVGWIVARAKCGQLGSHHQSQRLFIITSSSPEVTPLSFLPCLRAGTTSSTPPGTHTRHLEVLPDVPCPHAPKSCQSFQTLLPVLPTAAKAASIQALSIPPTFYLELISRLQISCKNKNSAKNTLCSLPQFPSC